MNKIVHFQKSKLKFVYKTKIAIAAAFVFLSTAPSPSFAVAPVQTTINLVQLIKEKKITLNLKNKSLRDILITIRQQTGIGFAFNNNVNQTELQSLSIEAKNESTEAVLERLLSKTKYKYSIVDNEIVILPKTAKSTTAQENKEKVQIKGRVIDEDGAVVAGATIIVQGTNNGAISDDKGAFTINATTGTSLEVSFVGLETLLQPITKASDNLVIKMKKNALVVDDVIVTGIFSRKAESFTGSSSTFKAQDLKQVGGQNVLQSLKTLDPTFNIMESREFGSDPNRLPDIEIRGKSSVIGLKEEYGTDPNQPLFILDGFETDLKTIVDLNMDRVSTVTILKDAASTAIYGSKAANGVVVIETKAPEKGKFRVSYSGNMFISIPDLSDYNLMNSREKLIFEKEAGHYVGFGNKDQLMYDALYNKNKAEIERGVDTYWMNEPLRTAITHKHNIYAEGGDDNIRYGIGATYNKTNGVMKDSDNEIIGTNFDLTYRKNKFSLSNKMSFDYYSQNDPTVTFSDYANANPYYRKTNEYGEIERYLELYYTANSTEYKVTNPLYNDQLNSFNKSNKAKFENKLSVEYKFTPELILRGRLGLSYASLTGDNFTSPSNPIYDNTRFDRKGSYIRKNGSEFIYDGDITLSYGKLINEIHQINAVAGARMRSSRSINESNTSVGYPVGSFTKPSFSAGYSEGAKPTFNDILTRSNSFYFNGGYTLKNRYLLDVNFRLDGASMFGSNKRYTETYAVGLAWNLHNEGFMKNVKAINRFKIRASIGNPGNQNFDAYQSYTTYNFMSGAPNYFGMSLLIDGLGNPNLQWQKTLDKNIGFDLTMLNSRLHVNFDYYVKDTDPLLAEIGVSSSVGVKTIFWNMGSQLGSGVSGTVKYSPIFRPQENINWTLSGTFKHQISEYRNIGNSLEQFNQANTNTSMVRYYDGGSPTSLWAVRSMGINPADGREVYRKKDGSYTYEWDSKDQVIVGNSEPKIEGVLGSTLYYKGFSFSMFFRYSLGGDVFTKSTFEKVENLSKEQIKYNQDRRALYERWRKPGDVANFRGISLSDKTEMSSRFVLRENYIKGESISVGYDFTGAGIKKAGFQSLRVQGTMNDLFRASSITEERGIEYPFARQFSVSLSVTF